MAVQAFLGHPTGLPVELSIASISACDGGLVLQIDDDGVGFPEDFVEARDAGIGVKLVRSLVENAGGTLHIESSPLGLRFTIQLPPQKTSRNWVGGQRAKAKHPTRGGAITKAVSAEEGNVGEPVQARAREEQAHQGREAPGPSQGGQAGLFP